MTTIILFFSIIINLFAILAIVILYLRQNHLLNVEKKQVQSMKEMEDIFSSYIAEMKEENEQFIKKIEKLKKEQDNGPLAARPIKTNESATKEANTQSLDIVSNEPYKRLYATKSYQNILDTPAEKKIAEGDKRHDMNKDTIRNDFQGQSFEDQVIFLHNQGLTSAEIAQNLNKGKTEIELLLKFRQKH